MTLNAERSYLRVIAPAITAVLVVWLIGTGVLLLVLGVTR